MITTVCYILRIGFANPIYVDVRGTQGIADDHLGENVDLPEKTPEAVHGVVGWALILGPLSVSQPSKGGGDHRKKGEE